MTTKRTVTTFTDNPKGVVCQVAKYWVDRSPTSTTYATTFPYLVQPRGDL